MRPGAGRSRSVILPCFCFKLTISLPPAQNLIQQWQRALSPGKQISGQFNSVNPRNSNHPSASGKMRLDILTWLNEPFSSSFLTCVLPHLPVCRFHFLSLQNYTQRAGYPPINGTRISPNAVICQNSEETEPCANIDPCKQFQVIVRKGEYLSLKFKKNKF